MVVAGKEVCLLRAETLRSIRASLLHAVEESLLAPKRFWDGLEEGSEWWPGRKVVLLRGMAKCFVRHVAFSSRKDKDVLSRKGSE